MGDPLVDRIGRLHRLAVFEAAARHESFTAAARELGVTQPGVARQVRALEKALARPLFDRRANRITLTAFGRDLLAATQRGFATIDAVAGRDPAGPNRFVLAANPGLAQTLLVPHLDGLQAALGDVEIHLWLFDRDGDVTVGGPGGFDAAIHLGRGPWTGLRQHVLFDEVTVPVAAPDLADRLGLSGDTEPADLLDLDLLHLDGTDRTWMTWTDWFAGHGLVYPRRGRCRHGPPRPRVTYNNYALVLQEAVAGVGIALGWRHLIDDLLERGVLVTVGPDVANPGSGYGLLWPPTTTDDRIARLIQWLDSPTTNSPG